MTEFYYSCIDVLAPICVVDMSSFRKLTMKIERSMVVY